MATLKPMFLGSEQRLVPTGSRSIRHWVAPTLATLCDSTHVQGTPDIDLIPSDRKIEPLNDEQWLLILRDEG